MRKRRGPDFRTQLVESLRTVAEALGPDPDSFRARYLSAALVDLAGGEGVAIPPAVAAAAMAASNTDAQDRRAFDEGLVATLWNLWRGFVSNGWLTEHRARALARPLIRGLRNPVHLLQLKRDSSNFRACLPEEEFDRAIRSIDPRFLRTLRVLKIDRKFLEDLFTVEELRKVRLEFHANGHLLRMSSRSGKCRLELDAAPGSGRFVEEGTRGGSGYLTVEAYRDGGIRGTFNSPWHDGEEYTEKVDWPLWVAESVAMGARAR